MALHSARPGGNSRCYVRDYARCILCYKCVQACGEVAQNTFAIAVAGRGFEARISTEFDVGLPDSACVYCGNCQREPAAVTALTAQHPRRPTLLGKRFPKAGDHLAL